MLSRRIPIGSNELVINQNLSYGYAGEVWDAALVFSYFLINKKSQSIIIPANKTVLELGAGTGIIGLITGALGAKKLILTDKGGCTKLLLENYELNKKIMSKDIECEVKELDWLKEDYKDIKDEIDYIVGSDLVWKDELIKPLSEVVKYFLNSKKESSAIFSFQIRDKRIMTFFSYFSKNEYKIEKLPNEFYDEEYRADDIIIVRILKLLN